VETFWKSVSEPLNIQKKSENNIELEFKETGFDEAD
jgi:hypothetical protein